MLLKRDILKGVENLKLQGEVFPFETNKQTNRRKGFYSAFRKRH